MIRRFLNYLTHWENWHWFAKYIVIGPAWLWLCLKARSFWFFTPSNPTIAFGGFVGETKREMYEQLPTGSYPESVYVNAGCSSSEVMDKMAIRGLTFPLAVKPDAGMMGFMFRKVDSVEQLHQYHAAMPVNYIIQELITYPLEVSVFYYRLPNMPSGCITGFLKKEYMEVTGDGKRSLRDLILDYPRAQYRLTELFSKHESKLNKIISEGEHYVLSEALNLSRGGKLINLEHEKDDQLLSVFDRLSHEGNFFYGRYDIKCESINDLKLSQNYSILEFNGCGAEPHHVYGNGNGFFAACKILVDHWKILYEISSCNRRRGIPHWSFMDGLRFIKSARSHFRKLQQLDLAFEFDKRIAPSASHRYGEQAETIFVAKSTVNQNSLA